jgi:hypothetical protein
MVMGMMHRWGVWCLACSSLNLNTSKTVMVEAHLNSLGLEDWITPSWTNSDTTSTAIIPPFSLTFAMQTPSSCTSANSNGGTGPSLSTDQLEMIRSIVQMYVADVFRYYLGTAGTGEFVKADLSLPTYIIKSLDSDVVAQQARARSRTQQDGGVRLRRRSLFQDDEATEPSEFLEDAKEERRKVQEVDSTLVTVGIDFTFSESEAEFRYSPSPTDAIQNAVLQQFLGNQDDLRRLKNDIVAAAINQNMARLCSGDDRGQVGADSLANADFVTMTVNTPFATSEGGDDSGNVPSFPDVANGVQTVGTGVEFTENGSGGNSTSNGGNSMGMGILSTPSTGDSVQNEPAVNTEQLWYATTAFIASMAVVGSLLLIFVLISSVLLVKSKKRRRHLGKMEGQYENDLAGPSGVDSDYGSGNDPYGGPLPQQDSQSVHLYESPIDKQQQQMYQEIDPMEDEGQMFYEPDIAAQRQKSVLDLMHDDDESSYEGGVAANAVVPSPYANGGGERVMSGMNSVRSSAHSAAIVGGQSSVDGYGSRPASVATGSTSYTNNLQEPTLQPEPQTAQSQPEPQMYSQGAMPSRSVQDNKAASGYSPPPQKEEEPTFEAYDPCGIAAAAAASEPALDFSNEASSAPVQAQSKAAASTFHQQYMEDYVAGDDYNFSEKAEESPEISGEEGDASEPEMVDPNTVSPSAVAAGVGAAAGAAAAVAKNQDKDENKGEDDAKPKSIPSPETEPMLRHTSLDAYDVCAATHCSSESSRNDSSVGASPDRYSVASVGAGAYESQSPAVAAVEKDKSTSGWPIKKPSPKALGLARSGSSNTDGSPSDATAITSSAATGSDARKLTSASRKWQTIASAIPKDMQVQTEGGTTDAASKSSRSETSGRNTKSRERSGSPSMPAQASETQANNFGTSHRTINLDGDVISMTSGDSSASPAPAAAARATAGESLAGSRGSSVNSKCSLLGALSPFSSTQRNLSPVQVENGAAVVEVTSGMSIKDSIGTADSPQQPHAFESPTKRAVFGAAKNSPYYGTSHSSGNSSGQSPHHMSQMSLGSVSLTASKHDLLNSMHHYDHTSASASTLDLKQHAEMDALRKMNMVKQLHQVQPQSSRRFTSNMPDEEDFPSSVQVDNRPPVGDGLQSAEDAAYERMIRARRLRR